ncbi:MAG: superoxide dismutase family protein [Pseudomonadota bacterium]
MIRTAAIASLLATAACAQMPWEGGPAGNAVAQAVEDTMDAAPVTAAGPSMLRMTGDIIGVDGDAIGALNILDGPHGVLIEATISAGGLEPGWHGLHLHQIGNCEDIGTFKNSGGHVGMIEGGHGLLNPAGPEGGDLPNIWAAADGSAGYEAFSTLTSAAALADEDGAALIIHEARDDHMSQPIGGAGGRVACAVIK